MVLMLSAPSRLDRLKMAAAATGRSRRSPLRRWMEAHRAEFAAMLSEVGSRPNWSALAAELSGMGLVDSRGEVPTAKVAALTWWKVKAAQGGSGPTEPPACDVPVVERPSVVASPMAEEEKPTPKQGRRLGRVGDKG
jgi:hypothetical protein